MPLRDEPPRLQVVVAHPDDESFGCGSLLLHAAAARATTAVCCATRGEAGQRVPGGGSDGSKLAIVREVELRRAAALLGVSRVEVLDFADSGMTGPAGAHTLVGVPFDVVRDRIRSSVEQFRPHVVVTLDASDGHRDHARIRDATLAAVEAASWPVERVYLHCLPQELMRRWLAHQAGANPASEHLIVDVPGTPEHLITTVVDTSRFVVARERAMAEHKSQTSPYDDLPADLRLDFLTSERLRRVVPPWTGQAGEERENDIFGAVAATADAVLAGGDARRSFG